MKTYAFDTATTTCPHCDGTGLCTHGTITTDHAHEWLECETCGKGIPAVVGPEFEEEGHRPVCATCGGKGVIRTKRGQALAHATT